MGYAKYLVFLVFIFSIISVVGAVTVNYNSFTGQCSPDGLTQCSPNGQTLFTCVNSTWQSTSCSSSGSLCFVSLNNGAACGTTGAVNSVPISTIVAGIIAIVFLILYLEARQKKKR